MPNETHHKRPKGWEKPYWARVGWYVTAVALSFLISLLVVRFGCGVLLRAAISAEPLVWRVVDAALDLLITLGAALGVASREGYEKRTARAKTTAVGGLLFLPVHGLIAAVIPATAGPLASTLAQLLYFGNDSIYAGSMEQPPLALTLACMAAVDVLVLIPTMVVGDRIGARAYKEEQADITGHN
ncbi:MAG: hypothetical protein IJN04_02085 [Clostridia bacterium]|nr:hypothetical protein [Clostridia bacterium]